MVQCEQRIPENCNAPPCRTLHLAVGSMAVPGRTRAVTGAG